MGRAAGGQAVAALDCPIFPAVPGETAPLAALWETAPLAALWETALLGVPLGRVLVPGTGPVFGDGSAA